MDQINSDLQSISKWSESNGFILNTGKCTALHVAARDLIQALSDNGVELGSAQRVSSQGSLLDEQSSNIIIISFKPLNSSNSKQSEQRKIKKILKYFIKMLSIFHFT